MHSFDTQKKIKTLIFNEKTKHSTYQQTNYVPTTRLYFFFGVFSLFQ